MIILLIISVLGFSLLAANIKAVKPSESPIISLSAAVILLYLFAIFKSMNFGVYFVFALGLASWPFTLVFHRKNIKSYLKSIAEPGFVVFAALAVALYFICMPVVTGAWDEYSHWALIVRNMLMTGSLPQPGGAVLYITYPPATPLFQYMFMKVTGGPEGMMYYAQSLLVAAGIAAMLKGQNYKRPFVLLLSFVLPVLAVVKFSVHKHIQYLPGLSDGSNGGCGIHYVLQIGTQNIGCNKACARYVCFKPCSCKCHNVRNVCAVCNGRSTFIRKVFQKENHACSAPAGVGRPGHIVMADISQGYRDRSGAWRQYAPFSGRHGTAYCHIG